MERPTGVTILAVLAFLGGVLLLVFGLALGSMFSFLYSGAAGTGIAALLVVFALIQFGVGYGYWVGATWAWWLGIIAAVLDVISIVTLNVFGLIIGIIMLYYLTRPHVKAWFHKA
jgi:hypothetical protein